MGLFDKKFCDVCGEKIGFLGNRKLEDGNLCKSCSAKLSPWFTGRRHTALADIKTQLEDREANKARAADFKKADKLGFDSRGMYIDGNKRVFAVCYESDWNGGNPDIIPLSSVKSCRKKIEEHKKERKYKDANGNTVSYNPPVYDYSYDFYIEMELEHPYIDDIRFKVNSMALTRGNGSLLSQDDRKIAECERICDLITDTVSAGGREEKKEENSIPAALAVSGVTVDYPAVGGMGQVRLELNGTATVLVRPDDVALYQTNVKMAELEVGKMAENIVRKFAEEGVPVFELTNERIREKFKAVYGGRGLAAYGAALQDVNVFIRMSEAPASVPAAEAPMGTAEWFCPACGEKNSGNFCTGCGTRRP
ncbi:MAG: DUF4428 domain-containing protein [Clostridia bacterium]|nr:DUF4428 domain-containing protein [Clostridia bacterium]